MKKAQAGGIVLLAYGTWHVREKRVKRKAEAGVTFFSFFLFLFCYYQFRVLQERERERDIQGSGAPSSFLCWDQFFNEREREGAIVAIAIIYCYYLGMSEVNE